MERSTQRKCKDTAVTSKVYCLMNSPFESWINFTRTAVPFNFWKVSLLLSYLFVRVEQKKKRWKFASLWEGISHYRFCCFLVHVCFKLFAFPSFFCSFFHFTYYVLSLQLLQIVLEFHMLSPKPGPSLINTYFTIPFISHLFPFFETAARPSSLTRRPATNIR